MDGRRPQRGTLGHSRSLRLTPCAGRRRSLRAHGSSCVRALLDLLMALRWMQQNTGAFGGCARKHLRDRARFTSCSATQLRSAR
ncbi:hypothetical protein AWB82_01358 [Caballeronia glebae]|uniref:Uncharacterized protein n=1 Tax=Caballeronia glebae TaxID=1777143 RepID=A0A157ZX58_9BURK|nr:hypothetical protein AWB82_01358 [Caballeronia glebae]